MGNSLTHCLPQIKKQEPSLDHGSLSQLRITSPGSLRPEDRLSSLTDDILLLILSFLPLKEMVKTSVFSRRWMNLWTFTPVLHFHAPKYTQRRDFVNWVDHVLCQHKGNSLKEFKIVCNQHMKEIVSWFGFALYKKVQHLEVNMPQVADVHTDNEFPTGILEFGNSWKADSHGGQDRVIKGGLKCLKSLSLKNVDVDSEAINFLLKNSPFLERLEVAGSEMCASLVFSGPNSALRYLQIKGCQDLDIISISNFSLVSLDIPSVGDLTLTGLPMLVELCISKASFITNRTISLASCCHSQLEVLTLQELNLKDLTHPYNLDKLTKLRRLVIEVQAWDDESLTMLISIITSCPRLEEFVLVLLWYDPKRTKRTMVEFERSSPSLQNRTLKVFEFLGYYGRVSDAELVIHIVKSAVCLEKIIIDPRSPPLLEEPCYAETTRELKARKYALKQFNPLKKYNPIPPHVCLVIR